MNQSVSPGHDLDNRILFPVEVSRRFDAVAPEIVHRAATGLFHIPEVRAVRAAVRFARAHPCDAPDASALNDFARLDHSRGEDLGFSIAVNRDRSTRGVNPSL